MKAALSIKDHGVIHDPPTPYTFSLLTDGSVLQIYCEPGHASSHAMLLPAAPSEEIAMALLVCVFALPCSPSPTGLNTAVKITVKT